MSVLLEWLDGTVMVGAEVMAYSDPACVEARLIIHKPEGDVEYRLTGWDDARRAFHGSRVAEQKNSRR